MYGARSITSRRKPIIVLDKRFKISSDLKSGDKFTCLIEAEVEGDSLIQDSEGNETYLKKLSLKGVEIDTGKLRTNLRDS